MSALTVDVWSDIACPFCFLGKHRFQSALEEFPDRADVTVRWRSFQLNPGLRTDRTMSINEYLSRHKGINIRHAATMNDRLARVGREEGLVYDFDRIVVANTFDAHRFLHFAAQQGKQDAAIERLFVAYFTDGKNVDDHAELAALGGDIGLDPADVRSVLESNRFADEVRADIAEAAQLGIDGVPFFVFDGRYGVSGAQERAVFLGALEESLLPR